MSNSPNSLTKKYSEVLQSLVIFAKTPNVKKEKLDEEAQAIIAELFDLCDKYIEQGDTTKARECLQKINQINSEIFEQAKSKKLKPLEGNDLPI